MTNKPTPTAADIQEACDLLNAAIGNPGFYTRNKYPINLTQETFAQLIAERNAERQRVSEIVKDCLPWMRPGKFVSVQQREALASLILPDPEPTPEDDLLKEAREIVREQYPEMPEGYNGRRVKIVVAALKRGMELTKIKGGDDAG